MADAWLEQQAQEWGVSIQEAQEYAAHVQGAGKYFAIAVAFPYANAARGVDHGVVVAVSTPESTRYENMHHASDAAGQVFQQSSWTKYDVWVFKNMNLLNFSGIHSAEHGGERMGQLDEFLDREYPQSQWRQKYLLTVGGQTCRHGLRTMLADIGVRIWLELEFGTSWRGYRCLDAYVALLFPGMPPPPTCAWYVLNHAVSPQRRRLYFPDDWYHCHDWLSIGQRPSMQEWQVSARQELQSRSYQEQATGTRRMNTILQHMSPQASPPALPAPPQGMLPMPRPPGPKI